MATRKVGISATPVQGREVWKPIPGFEGFYEVSDHGRVRSVDRVVKSEHYPHGRRYRGKVLSLWTHQNGYVIADLRTPEGKSVHKRVHRLVALAFLGAPPSRKHEPNHIDSDRTNNRPENLEWVTRSENLKHSYREGGRKAAPTYGEHNHLSKLTAVDVRAIRAMDEQGMPRTKLAKKFGVDYTNIWLICTRRSWKHVA